MTEQRAALFARDAINKPASLHCTVPEWGPEGAVSATHIAAHAAARQRPRTARRDILQLVLQRKGHDTTFNVLQRRLLLQGAPAQEFIGHVHWKTLNE